MRTIQPLLMAALLGSSNAVEDWDIKKTGKFFYADFKYSNSWKNSYAVEASVGSSREKVFLKLDTDKHISTIYTDACNYPSPCKIPGLFKLGSSKSKQLIEGSEGTKKDLQLMNSNQTVTVTGTEYKDEYLFKFEKWGRMITFDHEFLAIDNVSTDIAQDDHQGVIGLAPYSADLDNMEKNFMWQLKQQGLIDHMVASFYVDDDRSFVKFGSHDPSAVIGNFLVFHTFNVHDWALWMRDPMIGNQVSQEFASFVLFNPGYPFVYVETINPQRITDMLVAAGQKERVSLVCLGGNEGYFCYTAKSCNQLTSAQKDAFKVAFKLDYIDGGQDAYRYPFDVPGEELFVESEELGLDKGNCFISIFYEQLDPAKHSGQTRDAWTVGTKFFKKNYFAFDQTPFNEKGYPRNKVGIGMKNSENIVGQQHYDPSSKYYAPEDESLDQSIDIDGFEDPYKSFAFWLRDNKGILIFLICLFVFVTCCVAYIVRVQCKKQKNYTFRLYSENLNKTGIGS